MLDIWHKNWDLGIFLQDLFVKIDISTLHFHPLFRATHSCLFLSYSSCSLWVYWVSHSWSWWPGPVNLSSEKAGRNICIKPALQESLVWFNVLLSLSQAWSFIVKPRQVQLKACTQVLPDPEMFLNMRKARISLSSASRIKREASPVLFHILPDRESLWRFRNC